MEYNELDEDDVDADEMRWGWCLLVHLNLIFGWINDDKELKQIRIVTDRMMISLWKDGDHHHLKYLFIFSNISFDFSRMLSPISRQPVRRPFARWDSLSRCYDFHHSRLSGWLAGVRGLTGKEESISSHHIGYWCWQGTALRTLT